MNERKKRVNAVLWLWLYWSEVFWEKKNVFISLYSLVCNSTRLRKKRKTLEIGNEMCQKLTLVNKKNQLYVELGFAIA